MMHKAWSSIEEVPYCFSMSSVKFQGHTGSKIADFNPTLVFPDCNSSFNSPMLVNDAQSLQWHRRGVLLFFKVICQISRSHGIKKISDFDPNWAFQDCNPIFELNDSCEMMHEAWSSIKEMPYCFSRSSVKFQGHTESKSADFAPNWAFPDCNSRLDWLKAIKWCTKLEVA